MAYLVTHRSDGKKIPDTIAEAKIKRVKKPNKEAVKQILDQIKVVLMKEKDATNRKHLAQAGLCMNKILIR